MLVLDSRLESFARGCLVRRQGPPDVHQAYMYAFEFIGIKPSDQVIAACSKISNKMNSFAEHKKDEPGYHNRHHTIDTLMALASLLRIALNHQIVDTHEAVNAIIAMNGHDLFHDGTVNTPTHNLEEISAAAVRSILVEVQFSEKDIEIICDLILKTDPAFQFSMRAKCLDAAVDAKLKLPLLIGDSDLFASILPEIGDRLSQDLANEWRKSNINILPTPDTIEGRRNFLAAIKWLSPPSIELGMDNVIKQQLAVGVL